MKRRTFFLVVGAGLLLNGAFLLTASDAAATASLREEFTWEGHSGPIETCPDSQISTCDVF